MYPQNSTWEISHIASPWSYRPSIYQHVLSHLSPDVGLLDGGNTLPDDDMFNRDQPIRWVAGGLDGVVSHHARLDSSAEVPEESYTALKALIDEPTEDLAAAWYARIVGTSAINTIDQLIRLILERQDLEPSRLHAIAYWLATMAADREAVKFGIALLGLFNVPDDLPALMTLGRHEEFTQFVAVALQNSVQQPDRLLWELAKQVTGWGRITLVEQLANTQDAEIQAWLLREGYRNDVLNEYSALPCAIGGRLLSALQEANPDDALLLGAGEIIASLFAGGPGPGMRAYADGVAATECYLTHLLARESQLRHFNLVSSIEKALANLDEEEGWDVSGWLERREALRALIRAYVARPDWVPRIHAGLANTVDQSLFLEAAHAADQLQIDTWEIYFARLQECEDSAYWYVVAQTDDPDRFARVLRLAEQRLPLQEMATGPANELGLGPKYARYLTLDTILLRLRDFPGQGWAFVEAGLRSPVTRNRNMCLSVLSAWGKEHWPPEAIACLRTALTVEPNEKTRKTLQQILAGEHID